MVVHNDAEDRIEILASVPFVDHRRVSSFRETGRGNICPNCGIELPDESRRLGQAPSSTPKPSAAPDFVHKDYFKLLENFSKTESASAGYFNQGYFERFFEIVPPGRLGSGAHAQVFKVAHVLNGIRLGIFAVKRINVGDSQYLEQVLNEVLILCELSSRGANEHNLIRYNHVWMEQCPLQDLDFFCLSDDGTLHDAQDVPCVYILQQYCAGDHLENLVVTNFLREYTAKEKVERERQRRRHMLEAINTPLWLSDFEVWKFFSDIVNGVEYLHSHGILHRDLKPSNCLLESEYVPHNSGPFTSLASLEYALESLPSVFVLDFGEGKFIKKQMVEERRGNTGTIEFTDPKLWNFLYVHGKRTPKYSSSTASDVYSLGMILCFLSAGALPFSDTLTETNNPDIMRAQISGWYELLDYGSFERWFVEKRRERGISSPIDEAFGKLIYALILGAIDVLEIKTVLHSIKWNLIVDRKLSEATIVPEPEKEETENTLQTMKLVLLVLAIIAACGNMILLDQMLSLTQTSVLKVINFVAGALAVWIPSPNTAGVLLVVSAVAVHLKLTS